MNKSGNPTEEAARLAEIERQINRLLVDVNRLWTYIQKQSQGQFTSGTPTQST